MIFAIEIPNLIRWFVSTSPNLNETHHKIYSLHKVNAISYIRSRYKHQYTIQSSKSTLHRYNRFRTRNHDNVIATEVCSQTNLWVSPSNSCFNPCTVSFINPYLIFVVRLNEHFGLIPGEKTLKYVSFEFMHLQGTWSPVRIYPRNSSFCHSIIFRSITWYFHSKIHIIVTLWQNTVDNTNDFHSRYKNIGFCHLVTKTVQNE